GVEGGGGRRGGLAEGADELTDGARRAPPAPGLETGEDERETLAAGGIGDEGPDAGLADDQPLARQLEESAPGGGDADVVLLADLGLRGDEAPHGGGAAPGARRGG